MNGHQKQKEQSVRMIEEALFELMDEKDYTQITVSEIVKRADISRRTFYRFYKEKDEVLRQYFGRLCQEYQRTVPVLACYDIPQIAREYFGFWYQHKKFLMLMHKRGMDEMLYCEISRASAEIVKGRVNREDCKNIAGIEYFACYSAGGFASLLERWISEGMRGLPGEYAKKVSEGLLQFIRPSLPQSGYAYTRLPRGLWPTPDEQSCP